jgi:RHS repeat-associated protein
VHDANGNLSNKTSGANPTNSTNYIYDVEDRLVQVEDGSGIAATYYYDPFGRRLWKEVDGTRPYLLYSDEGLIGEYDSTGNEIKTYGWSPDSIWGTDPLFLKINGYYYFYQNDHQGTPRKLIGTNGLVVWAGVYDSFGNCQIEVAGIENNLRFAGQYLDAETGLHYNWLRYYDPRIGRYLRADPFGEGLNLYAYCFNNPHNWIDPFGLCATKSAWKSFTDWLIPSVYAGEIDNGYTDSLLIIAEALGWVGERIYSGECNWWVERVLKDAGYPLEGSKLANAFETHSRLEVVSGKPMPGDIIQFDLGNDPNLHGHVAIYLGNDRMITTTSGPIQILSTDPKKFHITGNPTIRYLRYKR